MSINLYCKCDHCRTHFDEGDVYCNDCYTRLEEQNEELKDENKELAKRINELEGQIDKLTHI